MKLFLVSAVCIFSALSQIPCHATAIPFKTLDENRCTTLKSEDLAKLPAEYLKYKSYIKLCRFKNKHSTGESNTSLVSVWAHDYLRSKGETAEWEPFPSSILIDRYFKVVGELPEIYPMDWVTHLTVSYGKWHAGRPEEIRVDVSNPAVSGDYYYPPLRWNRANERYEMTSQEPITGKRPKQER